MSDTQIIMGAHPERGSLFAVIDRRAHHVCPRIADRKFGAWLAPFRSIGDAEAALIAAGAVINGKRA